MVSLWTEVISILRNLHRGSGKFAPRAVVVHLMPEPYPRATYGHLIEVNIPGELSSIFAPFSNGQGGGECYPFHKGIWSMSCTNLLIKPSPEGMGVGSVSLMV